MSNTCKRLFYLLNILNTTDEEHALTKEEIRRLLRNNGIDAGRTTIPSDIAGLREVNIDIEDNRRGREKEYYLANRTFEYSEVTLLKDSVKCNKFITLGKCQELLKKLDLLVSNAQAKDLSGHVIVAGRIRTMNESIYYNTYNIHKAIRSGHMIRFHYYQWTINKTLEIKKDGAWYYTSPFELVFDNENYYMVAFTEGQIRHYRVDKMKDVEVVEMIRDGEEEFRKIDLAAYTRKNFSMYAGKEEIVKLLVDNELIGVMIDRFGTDIPLVIIDEDTFMTRVKVQVSDQFFGWITSFRGKAVITAPEEIKNDYIDFLERIIQSYRNES